MTAIVGSPDLEAETVGKVAKLSEERASTAIITGMKTRKLLRVFMIAGTNSFYIKYRSAFILNGLCSNAGLSQGRIHGSIRRDASYGQSMQTSLYHCVSFHISDVQGSYGSTF